MHSLIFHVDVNSAFLSWESAKRLRDNPDALDLRTINAVIGGDEKMRHGVVLAKSPSAKKYGIMTGEPLSHARQKCPELVVVPPDHELYAASSRKFIEILEEVAPVIEQCSIDEAFCDMTGTEKLRMTMESSRDSAMIPRLPIQPRNSQKIQESGTRPGRPASFPQTKNRMPIQIWVKTVI